MNSRTLLVSFLLFLLLLLPGSGTFASDAPDECVTSGGGWTVRATDVYAADCGGLDCTGISYAVVPNRGQTPDHVAVLVEHDANVIVPGSKNVAEPCAGDTVTSLGARDCSSRAVRMNQNSETDSFDLVAEGEQVAVGSSIVVKKGKTTEQCRIASLGAPNLFLDDNAQYTTSQTIDFTGCVVSIPTDLAGEGGPATLTGPGCAFVANGVPSGIAQLIVDGKDVGFLTQGSGYVSSGTDSCTTRIINRRIYSWCTCEDTDGDGASNDPSPPC
jgi:hypothetical protein